MVLKQLLKVASLFAVVALQGCILAPTQPDPVLQEAVLERWNRCLQRFDEKIEHYCDGHRRDVLAAYPVHLENQIDEMLSQQSRAKRASQVMKTGLVFAQPNIEQHVRDVLTGDTGTALDTDL